MTIFSKQAYKPGDVIIPSCQPFVHMVTQECKGKVCDHCLKSFLRPEEQPPRLSRCGGCKNFWYCGKECQRGDWKSHHKYECKVYQEWSVHPVYQVVLMTQEIFLFQLRVYLTIKGRPELREKPYPLPDGRMRTFNDLMAHDDKVPQAGIYAMLPSDVDLTLLRECCCKSRHNTFSIDNYVTTINKVIANGLYIDASIFNHSCRPNALGVWMGKSLDIRAVDNIEEGQEITISYSEFPSRSREKRREYLRDAYFFDCTCSLCESGHDPSSEFTRIDELLDEAEAFVENALCKMQLQIAKLQIANIYKYAGQLLSILEKAYGRYHPRARDIMFRMVYWSSPPFGLKVTNEEARAIVTKFKDYLEVTHGKEHPYYQKCLADGTLSVPERR